MDGAPPTSTAQPTARLWAAFDGDVPQKARLPMFCGVPPQLADDVMVLGTATSDAAATLLHRMPELMRHLAHQTTVRTERCVGHVRGPILWSETVTAWSSGIGVDDVFICGSPRRDFDVPENRLLVWALRRLVLAARRARGDGATWFGTDDLDRVRDQARAAQKLIEHRNFRGISDRKLNGREQRLVRKSRHRDAYEPAIALGERVARPFSPGDVERLVREPAHEDHRVITLLLEAVRARGHAVPMLTVRGDFVVTGALRYRNPDVMVDRRISGECGLFFGDVQVLTRADAQRTVARTDRFRDLQRSGALRLVETRADADALVAEVGERAAAQRLAGRSTRREPTAEPGPGGGVGSGGRQSASGLVQLPGSYSS